MALEEGRVLANVQEITLYGVAIFSVAAFALALFHEAEAKALRTKVRLLYASKMPDRLAKLQERLSKPTASGRLSKRPASWRGAAEQNLRLTLTNAVVKMGSRGNILLGSLLNSLSTPAIKHGFAASRINQRRLQLLSDVTHSAREFLDHCEIHSYLSKKPSADFFRRLVGSFPEILDVLCCLDDVSLVDVNALKKGIVFLARAVERIRDHPTPPLHTAVRECDLGAIVAFLVTAASEYERKAFGEVLAGLIRGYVPFDFRPLTLSPRQYTQSRDLQIRAGKLDVGLRVRHPSRGAGQLIDIDHAESRGKPYIVMYESGETHHCMSRTVPV